jgi:hypothetical protein
VNATRSSGLQYQATPSRARHEWAQAQACRYRRGAETKPYGAEKQDKNCQTQTRVRPAPKLVTGRGVSWFYGSKKFDSQFLVMGIALADAPLFCNSCHFIYCKRAVDPKLQPKVALFLVYVRIWEFARQICP